MKKVFAFITLACLAVAPMVDAGTLTLVSGPDSARVYGPLDTSAAFDNPLWGDGFPAVATWKHPEWPLLPGSAAVWISNTYLIEGNIGGNTWRLFRVTITVPADAWNISGAAKIDADDAEEVYVNGNPIGSDSHWESVFEYALTGLHAGENTVAIVVRNASAPWSPTPEPQDNPTGLIYSMDVTWRDPLVVGLDIKPETLNLKSRGEFTAFIDLPEGFAAEGIAICAAECAGAPARKFMSADDGRLTVKFGRADLVGVSPGDAVPLTVTGELTDGTHFVGSDTVRVIDQGSKKK